MLLHTGDFTQTGKLEEIRAFCEWFGAQPHPRKILIAGNHDLSLDKDSYDKTSVNIERRAADYDSDSISQQCI